MQNSKIHHLKYTAPLFIALSAMLGISPALAQTQDDDTAYMSNTTTHGPAHLRAIVQRQAAANNVPFPLADAVVKLESRYNPRASNRGNFGLMQIRLGTARAMGFKGGAQGLLDPETNARYGMKYLAQAYQLGGGDTCRTIMKYQSGHGATRMSGANRAYCSRAKVIMARG
jgi:soluble lytic murein transglycosylase-like protein